MEDKAVNTIKNVNNISLKYSLLYPVLAAAAGLLLRLMRVIHIDAVDFHNLFLSYNFIVFFGWFYAIAFLCIIMIFLRNETAGKNITGFLFWCTQLVVLITFTTVFLYGFNFFSLAAIASLTVLIYLFMALFTSRTARANLLRKKSDIEYKFIYAAMFFLLISTFGILRLVFVHLNEFTGAQAENPHAEETAPLTYFIMNFQLNGWLTFALIGLFIKQFRNEGADLSLQRLNSAFWFLFASLFFSCSASLTGFIIPWNAGIPEYIAVVFIFSAAGQFIGMLYLYREFVPATRRPANKWINALFTLFSISLVLKFTLPFIASLPVISVLVYNTPDVISGYAQLTGTGFLTFGIFILLYRMNCIRIENRVAGAGLAVFMFGFITDEILLFTNGLRDWLSFPVIPYYHAALLFTAFMMFLGIVLFRAGIIVRNGSFKQSGSAV